MKARIEIELDGDEAQRMIETGYLGYFLTQLVQRNVGGTTTPEIGDSHAMIDTNGNTIGRLTIEA